MVVRVEVSAKCPRRGHLRARPGPSQCGIGGSALDLVVLMRGGDGLGLEAVRVMVERRGWR